jgi:sugar lactone lactonase YvrE
LGSTIGPDKALYVTDGPGGRDLRVDPQTGAITTFASGLAPAIPDVASGASLIVDVEFSQGIWDLPVIPQNEGKPASPNTGRLVRVKNDGSFA